MSRPRSNTANPLKVTILGGGSFGTAMATVVGRKGHNVVMYVRDAEQAQSITEHHRNSRYMSQYELPTTVSASTNLKLCLASADFIVCAIPCQQAFDFLRTNKDLIPATCPIVSVSKGLYVKTTQLMSDVIPAALERPDHPTAFLSGPSFAKEVIERHPTTVVVASTSEELAIRVQKLFLSLDFRVYVSTDVIGVEVGGALKNVLAIASGIAQGMGFGTNCMAAIVTRGCAEMMRLGKLMGSDAQTLSGLSGYGDLMLTCFGTLSRNLYVGRKLGEGETLDNILKGMSEVAEGVWTARAVRTLAARYGDIQLPIMFAVAAVVDGQLTPKEAVAGLMALPAHREYD